MPNSYIPHNKTGCFPSLPQSKQLHINNRYLTEHSGAIELPLAQFYYASSKSLCSTNENKQVNIMTQHTIHCIYVCVQKNIFHVGIKEKDTSCQWGNNWCRCCRPRRNKDPGPGSSQHRLFHRAHTAAGATGLLRLHRSQIELAKKIKKGKMFKCFACIYCAFCCLLIFQKGI